MRLQTLAFTIAALTLTLASMGCKSDPPRKAGARARASATPTPQKPLLGTPANPNAPPVPEEEEEMEEERDPDRTVARFWRVKVDIVGTGVVSNSRGVLHCIRDEGKLEGNCGPLEVNAPMVGNAPPPHVLYARAAPGWRFVRWEAKVQKPDGGVVNRPPSEYDMYWRSFGKHGDTGELELVTAHFVPDPDAGISDAAAPDAAPRQPKPVRDAGTK